jgi:hypothetical protein
MTQAPEVMCPYCGATWNPQTHEHTDAECERVATGLEEA